MFQIMLDFCLGFSESNKHVRKIFYSSNFICNGLQLHTTVCNKYFTCGIRIESWQKNAKCRGINCFLKIILFAAIATFFWVQTDEMEEINNFSIDKFTFINQSFNVSGVYRPILAFI